MTITRFLIALAAMVSTPHTMTIAKGTFDVTVAPQPTTDSSAGAFGQFYLDKTFHGDLEGTSKGHMLASGDPRTGNGVYVALERVTGALGGRHGSFVLAHRGILTAGATSLEVSVVPASGTEELAGIAGEMKIIIEGKKHSYELTYTLK